eukprot:tig00000241_g20960.t1
MKRPSKRRRVAADAAGEPEQQAPASPIERLSDELLGEIFSHLQMEEAWRLRSVCKAWDQIIRSTTYRKLYLCCSEPEQLSALIQLLKQAMATDQLEEVSLALEPSGLSEEDSREMWSNALAVLSVVANEHAGRGPRHISFTYYPKPNFAWTDVVPVDSLVLAPLLALRPPPKDGLDAPSALEEIHLAVRYGVANPDHTPQIPIAALRSTLAPFSNLRHFDLRYFTHDWPALGEAQAAVLAECCPQLTSLSITPVNADAVRRLAPLRLEKLALSGPLHAGSFSALAEGEAGKTLKDLRCTWDDSFTQINGEDLRSVARFPQLQLLTNFCIGSDVMYADVAALRAAPNLKKVRISHRADRDPVPLLCGLTTAVRSSRSLESLGLMLEAPADTNSATVAGFITAASTSRVLQELEFRMRLWRPLTAEEVAALRGCDELGGTFTVECFLDSPSDLLALEAVRGMNNICKIHISVATDDPALFSVAKGVLCGWCNPVEGREFSAYHPKSNLTELWSDDW